MRVLITGGAGALAETLIPYLEERGHKVTLLDYFEINFKYPSIIADIRSIDILEKSMIDQDIVIHTAALHGVHLGKYKTNDIF